MARAFLAERSRIAVRGPDSADFLQGLITTDLDHLEPGIAVPGALLTPQGKIMFFFMVSRDGDGFSLETEADSAEAFAKRLTMYKLRAKVEIGQAETAGTTIIWDEAAPEGAIRDSRFAKAGIDLYRIAGGSGKPEGYDRLRARAGIAEAGADFALQDAFPHDILMDKSGGVSFKKGCYVGQEVVSRMQHRSTARRRLVTVSADTPLPAQGTDIVAGGKALGALGTVAGDLGLAIVRIDRAGSAFAAGLPVTAGDCVVSLALPGWSDLEFPSAESED